MKCTVNKDVSFRVSPMAAFILRRNQELTCNKTKKGYRVWLKESCKKYGKSSAQHMNCRK